MKPLFFIVTIAITVSSLIQVNDKQRTKNKQPTQETNVEQEVKEINRQFYDALVHGDTTTLRRLLSDDWMITHSTGKVETKTQYIAAIESGERKYKSIDRDEINVRVYGAAAVLTCRTVLSAESNGQPYKRQNRYIHVYVKRDGHWQAVASQGTGITQ